MERKRVENKNSSERGVIISFFSGVAKIQGLDAVFVHELLVDASGNEAAIVIGFDAHAVEALFFDEKFDLSTPVYRTGKPFSIRISDDITGRIIDGSGKPMDGLGAAQGLPVPVFAEAPPIIAREPIVEPLSTGIKIIDANLPLGRGQRELIIGDRKLGKSTIAIDTVMNQKKSSKPVHCVYVLCGQKEQALKDLIVLFEKNNTFLYATIVAASAGTSFAEQYLAPFVGCAIGEYFRDKGKDALVVYDDLSKHAKAYRDISLLLERAPGREAYPGDIFSLHGKLLERAAKIAKERGNGSLTALPIAETQEGDIASFIPTNLISITDGQIYLENGLFQKGFLPAINVGLSVSRVGSQAQPPALKQVVGGLRLTLSQHKQLQKLLQLETTMSAEAQKKINRGDLTLEMLKQDKHTNVTWPEQSILFFAAQSGLCDDIERSRWTEFETSLLDLIRYQYPDVIKKITGAGFSDAVQNDVKGIIADFKSEFAIS
jgi:F-type H+-transporting ATPase subunit alpha